jgi:excisionase family DNA binding protein
MLCDMTSQRKQIESVNQAAERLGCTRQNVLYLLAKGRIDGWQINGKAWAVVVASVDKYRVERDAK